MGICLFISLVCEIFVMKIFSTGDQPNTADELAKVKLGETSLDQSLTIRNEYSRLEGTMDHICTVSFGREHQAETRDSEQLCLRIGPK